MSVFLERIDSAPLETESFGLDFISWISVFIDTLNETLRKIESRIVSSSITPVLSITGEINSSYIISNAATTTVTLPDTAPVGALVQIIGSGAGGWVLKPGAGQTIKILASSASVSITSSGQYDCITVVCVDANTTWVTVSSQTGGFIIT